MGFISTTPYLYNANLGMLPKDLFEYRRCEIGMMSGWATMRLSPPPSARSAAGR